ncbi:hypothetical protein LTR27_010958 [Elasticomyces elasticus]|nr:hypothetical protein LTR27_010958 [Elasticomyces elasticus]
MPKRAQEQYDNDGGFVEDAPRSKKAKNTSSGKSSSSNEVKKATISTEVQTDDEGNEYWELSRIRRVGVSTFKNATMVNIREYYEKDGKSLPGKKGISLSIDQYTTFLAILPQLEDLLKSKGIDVPRPKYDGASSPKAEQEDEDDDDEAKVEEKDEKPVLNEKPGKSKLDRFKLKANHEETSDEDEG